MSRGDPEGNAVFPGTDGIRGRRVFGAADLTERLRALTGGDKHGTQVERVPQWTPVRMRRTGHRRREHVREVPLPRSLAAPQASPQFRRINRRAGSRQTRAKGGDDIDRNNLSGTDTGRGSIPP